MTECTLDDLVKAHAAGATVVDVREADEYASAAPAAGGRRASRSSPA